MTIDSPAHRRVTLGLLALAVCGILVAALYGADGWRGVAALVVAACGVPLLIMGFDRLLKGARRAR